MRFFPFSVLIPVLPPIEESTWDKNVVGTLTKLTYARRYNVAVSRAKDQLWLFHSVELNELSVNCERAKLLTYCLSPDLEKEIEYRKEVPLDELVKPFDSLFEQTICPMNKEYWHALSFHLD